MMANRYLTLTLTGERIENANGDISADGKSVTWKVPLMILMNPPAGYRQEFRADGNSARYERRSSNSRTSASPRASGRCRRPSDATSMNRPATLPRKR
jgi:hypothetical protein